MTLRQQELDHLGYAIEHSLASLDPRATDPQIGRAMTIVRVAINALSHHNLLSPEDILAESRKRFPDECRN